MDITQLILDDHHEQRRLFAILEQIDVSETAALKSVWKHLASVLEIHAEAEERLFYPELLKLGEGAGGEDSAQSETCDAITDHNEIRDAITVVNTHRVGSGAWFKAVAAANKANGDHMAEEEREGLTDFRQHAGFQLRHALGVDFIVFETDHVTGVRSIDKEPKAYIAQHG